MGNTMGRGVLLVFCAIFAVVFGAGGYWAGLRPLAETAQAAWTVRNGFSRFTPSAAGVLS